MNTFRIILLIGIFMTKASFCCQSGPENRNIITATMTLIKGIATEEIATEDMNQAILQENFPTPHEKFYAKVRICNIQPPAHAQHIAPLTEKTTYIPFSKLKDKKTGDIFLEKFKQNSPPLETQSSDTKSNQTLRTFHIFTTINMQQKNV